MVLGQTNTRLEEVLLKETCVPQRLAPARAERFIMEVESLLEDRE